MFCTLLASLKFRLPHKGLDAAGMHGHVFLNGGNLISLSGMPRRGPSTAVSELASNFRWSAVSRKVGCYCLSMVLRLAPHECILLDEGRGSGVGNGHRPHRHQPVAGPEAGPARPREHRDFWAPVWLCAAALVTGSLGLGVVSAAAQHHIVDHHE